MHLRLGVSRIDTSVCRLGGGERKLVTAFILRNPDMSLDPHERDFMLFEGVEESLPEINVLRSGLSGPEPVLVAPFEHRPVVDGFHEIFGIAVERDATLRGQGFQTDNGGQEFHAVIRADLEALREFLASPPVLQNDTVPGRAGIGFGRPVGVDDHVFQGRTV